MPESMQLKPAKPKGSYPPKEVKHDLKVLLFGSHSELHSEGLHTLGNALLAPEHTDSVKWGDVSNGVSDFLKSFGWLAFDALA